MQRALLHFLVMVSGASGLVYQVLWVRALGLHFGTATPAIATVVATFMGGLALGNALFGRHADRSARPLRLYRLLELGIGGSGLGVSWLLLRAGAGFDALASGVESLGWAATPVRVIVLAALMVVPTTLMGGTLPVLMRALLRSRETGKTLGALYACNTLGAVAGALLPDFWLIPQHGMTAAACAAAAGNLFVAMSVPALATVASAAPIAPAFAALGRSGVGALCLSALSGFAGLALEVLWSRTLSHWTASIVTSFAVLLAVYLVALSLGTGLTRRLADRSRFPLTAAGAMLSLAGVCAYLAVAGAPLWRTFEREVVARPPSLQRLALWQEALDALLHASYLAVPACLLMGGAFPFLVAAVVRQGAAGADTGRLFTINTLAGVLGSLVAGFQWLPILGEQDSYLAAALLLTLGGALAALLAGPRKVALSLALVGLGVVLALASLLPRAHLLTTHFRVAGRIVEVREGATTTAAAAARYAYGEPHFTELLTPGVSMASTNLEARRYMGIMAHVAMLLAQRAERALLICYGTGNTARALLSYDGLRRLDVVDLSSEVLSLSERFARGRDPLLDPRVRVFVDDGRHHLIARAERYDVITTEPPPPNQAGVANLYSREFYALVRARLRPGGVMTQWLPVFQLSERDALAMIAAFVEELPHTALLYGHRMQWVLVGSDRPLGLEPTRAAARTGPKTQSDLRSDAIPDLADFHGGVLQTDAQLRALVAAVEPLSDDRPTIQYPWDPLGHYARYADRLQLRADRVQAFGRAEPALTGAVEAHARAVGYVLRALRHSGSSAIEHWEATFGTALQPALAARPGHEGMLELLGIDAERMALAERALARPGARRLLVADRAQLRDPRFLAARTALEEAALDLARRRYYARDYAGALHELRSLRVGASEAARHALLEAGSLRALMRPAEAAAAFERAAARSRHAEFRRLARALARRAAEPFAADRGPLSLSTSAARAP